jgi:hypothetical protein
LGKAGVVHFQGTDGMSKQLEAQVDDIMGQAHHLAWRLVRQRIHRMMKRNPKRFKEYHHAVGWGPTFIGPNGKTVESEDMNARERKLYDYLIAFYDRYGGNNAKVVI